MEGRVDNLRGLNRGRPFDEPSYRLQHFGIRIGAVRLCVGFVVPQTDGGHIGSTGAGECNFILKAVLLTKQRKIILVKCPVVISKHIRFQMKRDVTSKHMSTSLRLSFAKSR